jgi:hypothetical protein
MRRVSSFDLLWFLKLRLIMMRIAFPDRRKFLQWGALGGLLVAAGCSGGSGSPSEVTTPPVGGGNRALLKKNEEGAKATVEKAKSRRKIR